MTEKDSHKPIVSYYDTHTKFKISDYVKVNPRVNEAWLTLAKNAPKNPKRILEVGCGMGGVCHKISKKWPQAKVTGIDISLQSIDTATKLFANHKVDFKVSLLSPDAFNETFDYIIFMDVYEHIAVTDRQVVHAALKKLLNNKGKIFLSVPTPQNLKWSLINKPETMQPVDEHISFNVIAQLANDTQTEVQFYENKSIWNTADYAHVILEKNDNFEASFFFNKPVTALQRAKRIVSKGKNLITKPFRMYWVHKNLG